MIQIGQNARGEWGWMLFAGENVIASGEGLLNHHAALAIGKIAARAYVMMAATESVASGWPIEIGIFNAECENGAEPKAPRRLMPASPETVL